MVFAAWSAACGGASKPGPEPLRIPCVDRSYLTYRYVSEAYWASASVSEARLMVACGPGLGSQDGLGRTPLHLAARYGAEPAAVAVLLEHGADIEARDDFHNTPLHAAIEGGNPDTVSLLLEHGADIEARDDIGANPLHRAVAKIIGTIAASLKQGTFTEGFDWIGDTALLAAIDARHPAIVALLLEHGADTEARDYLGHNALLAAIAGGEPAIVRMLLEHGVNVEAINKYGDPALHAAAEDAKYDLVGILLDYGADIEAKDEFGRTPLESAALRGDRATMLVLLNRGAEVGDLYWSEPTLRQLIDELRSGTKPAVPSA